MPDAVGLRPSHGSQAGEFRAVVGANGLRITAKSCSLIEHAGHVLARDAEIHHDVHALMAEVIGHDKVLQAPPAGCGQSVGNYRKYGVRPCSRGCNVIGHTCWESMQLR